MSWLSIFGGDVEPDSGGERLNPDWVKAPRGGYFHLMDFDLYDEAAKGVGGVVVAWHGGLHPEWLYVNHTKDAGALLKGLRQDHDIKSYEARGHVFVTWAPLEPRMAARVHAYLAEALHPQLGAPAPNVEPKPAYIPG